MWRPRRPPRSASPAFRPRRSALRYQSFTAGHAFTDDEAVGTDLPDRLERSFAALVPMARWLDAALGLREADRR